MTSSIQQAQALVTAEYRLPPGHGMIDQTVGGGDGSIPSKLRRPIFNGTFINMALSVFKAFHYQDKTNLPGATYQAYQPPLGFSTWLR